MKLSTAKVISQVNTWATHSFDGCLASHQDRAYARNRHTAEIGHLPVAGNLSFGSNYQRDQHWDADPAKIARMVRAADEVYFVGTSCQDGGRDEYLKGYRRDPRNPQKWIPFYESY